MVRPCITGTPLPEKIVVEKGSAVDRCTMMHQNNHEARIHHDRDP